MAFKFDPEKIIKASDKYDRDSFVKAMNKLSDLGKYASAIRENPNNPDALKNLGSLLHEKPDFYLDLDRAHAINDASEAQSGLVNLLGGWVEPSEDRKSLERKKGYVEENFDRFFEEFDEEGLEHLVKSLQLYVTGNEEVDEVIKAANEVKKIAKAAKEGGIESYVIERIKKAPKWAQVAVLGFSGNSQAYMQKAFQSYAKDAQISLEKAIRNEKGEIDKKKLEGVIRKSLKTAIYNYDEEKNLGDKSDIFEGDIRPYFTTIAEALYPKAKKDKELDEDKDTIERKVKRREIGMSN